MNDEDSEARMSRNILKIPANIKLSKTEMIKFSHPNHIGMLKLLCEKG